MPNPPTSGKIIALETLRGIAAFIVFLFHFVLAFFPGRHGQEPRTLIEGGNLKETPLFFFINGHAAVVFFFVLSGFVLSQRYFLAQKSDGLSLSVLKRWPRLFPLALLSTLLSVGLLKCGWYFHHKASRVTKSYWFESFGRSNELYESAGWFEGITQGAFFTFFRGDMYLNTSLWTMRQELLGSMVVFAIIPLLIQVKGKVLALYFLLFLTLFYYINIFMIPFLFGVFFSHFHASRCSEPKEWAPRIRRSVLVITTLLCVLILGYIEPGTGFYSFLNFYDFDPALALPVRIFLHSLAATVLLLLVLNSPSLSLLLSKKWGAFLGRISFALYVFHVPIMFSVTSFVFLSFRRNLGYTASAWTAFLLTLPILFTASWLLTRLDEHWCRWLNRVVRTRLG